MIDGLFFLLSCVGMALLVTWMMQNDHVRSDGRTSGFLAMTDGDTKDPAGAGKQKPSGTRRFSQEG